MKKYWLIGLYALALTSCDSFLNCEPENSFSSEGFLESESDLRLYTNGFLQSFLPSEEIIAWGGDQYADFCATRSSTTFLIGDTWDDTQQGGWGTGDWGDLRQINYFLDNLPNAKGKVTDAIYLHNPLAELNKRIFKSANRFVVNVVYILKDCKCTYFP